VRRLVGEMSDQDHQPPPRVAPKVKAAPRIRQVYWCRLPTDAELPEPWKVRPVIIVSYRNTLHGAVTAIPTTTVEQVGNPWGYRLHTSLDPSRVSWAICDKPITIAVSRLQPRRTIPRLTEKEFDEVLSRLPEWLPKLSGP
jgi:mRNA interferase MazF